MDGTSLEFSGSDLQLLPDLTGYHAVHTLKAGQNLLSSLHRLPPNLRRLLVPYNKLAFPGNIDTQAPGLEEIDFSNNRLLSLEGLSQLKALQTLNISHNYIGDDQIQLLKHLNQLKALDISHNHLREFDLDELFRALPHLVDFLSISNEFFEFRLTCSMRKLQRIVLDTNKLQLLEFHSELPSLELLSVCENSLKTIQGLHNLPNLTELYTDNNELSILDESWQSLTQLSRLSLKHNRFAALQNLPKNLEILDISHNKLSQAPELQALNQLFEFYACYNEFTQIPQTQSPLAVLQISHNRLQSLSGLPPTLKLLDVSHNKLGSWAQILSPLTHLTELESLDLRGLPMSVSQRLNLISKLPGSLIELNGLPIEQEESKIEGAAAFNIPSLRQSPMRQSHSIRDSPYVHRTPKNSIASDLSLYSDMTKGSKLSLWDSQQLKSPAPPQLGSPYEVKPFPFTEANNTLNKLMDMEDFSVSQLESCREIESTLKSNESVIVTTAINFKDLFNHKEKELSERISRLDQGTLSLLSNETSFLQETQGQLTYGAGELTVLPTDTKMMETDITHAKRKSHSKPPNQHTVALSRGVSTRKHSCCCRRKKHCRSKKHQKTQPKKVDQSTSPAKVYAISKGFNQTELLNYGVTPLRPVFISEGKTTLLNQLHVRSKEFQLLQQLFSEKSDFTAIKTYTHFQTTSFTSTYPVDSSVQLKFFVGSLKEFQVVASSPVGFKELKRPLEFRPNYDSCCERAALVSIVASNSGPYLEDPAQALPVYLVEFKK